MFHPDALLKIGHDREAELIRDAEACDVPQSSKGGRPRVVRAPLSLAVTLAAVAMVLVYWLGR